MTAEEYFEEWNLAYYYESKNHNNLIKIMNDYAKLKCRELLKIVVDKAEENFTHSFGYYFEDKSSILNVVDLDEFIN